MVAPAVEAAVAEINLSLLDLGVSFALVGGLAVSARSRPRFTRDADFAVSVRDDAEAERILFGLFGMGHTLHASIEQKQVKRLATTRLYPRKAGDVIVDLLFASSGIEPELVAAAEEHSVFPGVALPVASVGHLLAMKTLSRGPRRPDDDSDLVALLDVASARDLKVAVQALRLMQRRGFARDKQLLEEWQIVLQRFRATTGD